MIEGRPRESLVLFDNPIEISARPNSDPFQRSFGGAKKKATPSIESKPRQEEILNAILPPRQWLENNGKSYIQYVSHQPATRVDVAKLREMLDQKLMERQARESGICPVREELFSQCFDEIIRQITLNEPERGLLLLRIRDEIKMTIAAYQTLYQSSVNFAMRKQVQSEIGKAELDKRIEEYEALKKEKEDKIVQLKSKIDAIERRDMERREIMANKRKEDLNWIKMQEQHLGRFLKDLNKDSNNK